MHCKDSTLTEQLVLVIKNRAGLIRSFAGPTGVKPERVVLGSTVGESEQDRRGKWEW
jgi:hypothetical protein